MSILSSATRSLTRTSLRSSIASTSSATSQRWNSSTASSSAEVAPAGQSVKDLVPETPAGLVQAEVVSGARKTGLESFEFGAKEALLSNAEDWGYDEEITQLEVELKSVADVFRRDETKKIVNGIEVCIGFRISVSVH